MVEKRLSMVTPWVSFRFCNQIINAIWRFTSVLQPNSRTFCDGSGEILITAFNRPPEYPHRAHDIPGDLGEQQQDPAIVTCTWFTKRPFIPH
jgi:hypothetical protein